MRFALGRSVGFALASYTFLVTMLGTTLPTPLYPLFQRRYSFGELLVTVIFAIYALGVMAALLLAGQRSDEIGRRPVLLTGLAFATASSVIFLVASALAPLLVARLFSGFSAGIFTGTATATLVDLAPGGARARGTLVATLVNIGGLGLGPLLAGLLAQFAPDPLRLSYAVHLGLLAPAIAAVWLAREPHDVKPGTGLGRLRIQRLRVPREVRPIFIRAGAASFAAFSVLGLFTAVAPLVVASLLHLHSYWLSGVVVFILFAAALAGQVSLEWMSASTALPLGCAVLFAGAGVIAGAVAESSLVLLILGTAIAGLGTGLNVRAGLTMVNSASPSAHRAEVASSFFVVSYVAISIPIIGIGVAAQAVGLRPAGIVFTCLVAVLALAVLVSLMRRDRAGPRAAASEA
jgi:MFS family permease